MKFVFYFSLNFDLMEGLEGRQVMVVEVIYSTDCNVNVSSNILRITEFNFDSHFTLRLESEGGG